jgi:hypothetical protein
LTSILAPSGGFARYALNGTEDKTGNPSRRKMQLGSTLGERTGVGAETVDYKKLGLGLGILSPAHWGLWLVQRCSMG